MEWITGLKKSIDFMEKNLCEKITFSDIVQELSVSPTTLKMIFARTYGHGAMEHLTLMRIEKSKELLREGSLSCTDISSACGFCSVHHFSGVFKKYEGMSPTEYVKSIKSMLEEGRF